MPYLKIQTNIQLHKEYQVKFLTKLSKTLEEILQKPEKYIMTILEQDIPLFFAGSDEPAVFAELKSIGLNISTTEKLTRNLCDFLHNELGVKEERIYIEFSKISGEMWGWNGKTFK